MQRARQSIDRALLSMKLNVTRNMSQEMVAPAWAITRDFSVDKNQSRSTGVQANRVISSRNPSTLANGTVNVLHNLIYEFCLLIAFKSV